MVINILQKQLRSVVAQSFGQVAPQLAQSRRYFLHYVGVDLIHVTTAPVLYSFEESYRQSVIVHPSACVKGRYYNCRIGYGIVPQNIVHPLTNIPAVDVIAVEEAFVSERDKG